MAKKATITPVTDTVNNAAAINTQLNAINNKLDNTLSLDGSVPNAMGADLDMNSNDILNVNTLAVADLTVGGLDVNTALNASVAASAASAASASTSATAASLSATQAAQYDGIWLDDVATLLADTTLTYTAGQPSTVVVGDYVRTRKEGFAYQVAASGDVTTAGSIQLDVLPNFDGSLSAEAFGVVGDGVADDTVRLQTALDTAGPTRALDLGNLTYKTTSNIKFKGPVKGDGWTIKPSGVMGDGFNSAVSMLKVFGDVVGGTIDCANVTSLQYGFFCDVDFAQDRPARYDFAVKNVLNSDNTQAAIGACWFKFSSDVTNMAPRLDISVSVDTVTATANATIGDAGGSAKGIYIYLGAVGVNPEIYIHDCTIRDVSPNEDGDCVHVAIGSDYQDDGHSGQCRIERVQAFNGAKRHFKVQMPNTTIIDCWAEGPGYGYDTYSPDTTFIRCNGRVGITIWRSDRVRTSIIDCWGETTWPVSLETTAESADTVIRNVSAKTSYAYGAGLGGNFQLYGAVTVDGITSVGTGGGGSGVVLLGTSVDVQGSNIKCSGFNTGIYASYSTGRAELSQVDISGAVYGINRIGATPMIITLHGGTISASSIAVYTLKTSVAAICNLFGVDITTASNGVITPTGSRTENCTVTSTAGVATGSGIDVKDNSRAFGNRVIGLFTNGIASTYTTTAEVSNNVVIGATTKYLTTGFTAYINHDNYSR